MHRPRKRFGQHFLHDSYVIDQIVKAISPKLHEHLVEIGPGQGALTFPVLKIAGHLDVIEIDRDLAQKLRVHQDQLTIYEQDALDFDFSTLIKMSEKLRVFGNLPYNISTPLIFHLLDFAPNISDMHFMLQKEVVDRMAAAADSEDYGRLSVMVQYHCRVESLFDVFPESFDPPPKVDSSIVRLIPHDQLPYLANNYLHFSAIVKQAFSQRRKTLRNSLRRLLNADDWTALKIDPQLRPEQLTVEEFVKLSNRI